MLIMILVDKDVNCLFMSNREDENVGHREVSAVPYVRSHVPCSGLTKYHT